jgi:hypothetical protein
VLVEEVDGLDSKASEGVVAGAAHIVRVATDAAALGVGRVPEDSELGGKNHLVAPAAEEAPQEFLVRKWSVHIGGVQKGDAELKRAPQGGDRFRVIPSGVELRHPHAPEPLSGHDQALPAEGALNHGAIPSARNAATWRATDSSRMIA